MSRKLKKFEPGLGFSQADWDEVSDNPELTGEQLKQGRPFREAFPELATAMEETIKRKRGKQKAPTKELISLRVDRSTLDAYRTTGRGWQKRMSDALRAQAPRPTK
jgi:uncharacterized protein (DUF4415 family)